MNGMTSSVSMPNFLSDTCDKTTEIDGNRLLSLREVIKVFNISSPEIIHNWLEGDSFPGVKIINGQRKFRVADVCAVLAQIDEIKARNAAGYIEIPDSGDEDPYAGRY
jgi:hypothetical protein